MPEDPGKTRTKEMPVIASENAGVSSGVEDVGDGQNEEWITPNMPEEDSQILESEQAVEEAEKPKTLGQMAKVLEKLRDYDGMRSYIGTLFKSFFGKPRESDGEGFDFGDRTPPALRSEDDLTLDSVEAELGDESLDFDEVVAGLKADLELGEAKRRDPRGRLANLATKVAVNLRGLNFAAIRKGLEVSSVPLGGKLAPEMPEDWEEKFDDEDGPWNVYSNIFLKGEGDFPYPMTEEEHKEARFKSRFCEFTPVTSIPSEPGDIARGFLDILTDDEHSFIWYDGENEDGTKKEKRTYGMDIDPSSIAVYDLGEGGDDNWDKVNPERHEKQMVVIKLKSGDIQSGMEHKKLSGLMDRNKAVVFMVEDENKGNYIMTIRNHEGTAALKVGHWMGRMRDEMCGGKPDEEEIDRDGISQQMEDRFNMGESGNGTVKSRTITPERKAQVDELYQAYKAKVEEVSGGETKLSYATFWQLMILKASGGKGGVLGFDQRYKQELNHYGLRGDMDDLKKALEGGKKLKVASILDIYSEKRSNIAFIGKARNQLETPQQRYQMSYVTWKSGAARDIAGTVLTSVIPEGFTLRRGDGTKDDVEIDITGSSAIPPFMDGAHAIHIPKEKDQGGTVRIVSKTSQEN